MSSRVHPPPRERSAQVLLKGLGQVSLTRLRRSPSPAAGSARPGTKPRRTEGRAAPRDPADPHRAPGHCATRRARLQLRADCSSGPAAPTGQLRDGPGGATSPHGCPFPPPSPPAPAPPPRHGPRPSPACPVPCPAGSEGPGAVPLGRTRGSETPRGRGGLRLAGKGRAAAVLPASGARPCRRLFPPGPAVPRACSPCPAGTRGCPAGRARGSGRAACPRQPAPPSSLPAACPRSPPAGPRRGEG